MLTKPIGCALVLVLLLSASDSQSQQPVPSPDISAQPKQEEAKPAQQHSATDKQPASQQPIIVNVLPPQKSEREIEEEQRERNEKSKLDRRLVGLTADLAIFTAILAIATVVLAAATAALWYATKKLVKGAEETARRQLRAYVGVQRCWQKGIANRPRFEIIFENFGQTPAKNGLYWVALTISTYENPNDIPIEVQNPAEKGTFELPPGAAFTVDINRNGEVSVPNDLSDAFNKKEIAVYVFGRLDFVDAFGDKQWLVFRHRFAVDVHEHGDLHSCEGYNESS